MKYARESMIATLVSMPSEESVLCWYTKLISGRRHPHTQTIRINGNAVLGTGEDKRNALLNAVNSLNEKTPVGFLVADWGRDMDYLQALLHCASVIDMPAVLVRQASLKGIRRVVVATSGGLHATRQMWVAREISNGLNVPLRVIRLIQTQCPDDNASHLLYENARREALEDWTSGLLGIEEPAEIMAVPDPTRGILNYLRMGDVLVMGVPGPFYIAERFSDSIPATVARQVRTPIVLLRSRRPDAISLRSVFWGRLSLPGLRPRNKKETILSLVDALVQHHQVPLSSRPDLVDRAGQREGVMSTAVDCETAFPHIRLPGFRGVAGSMAICPDGVDFGSGDGELTRFIYLLITPDGYCDEHLSVQAKIARRMMRPEVRSALLGCSTSEDILDVLEPCGVSTGWPYGRSEDKKK